MVPVYDEVDRSQWVQLCDWFSGRVGSTLLAMERKELETVLADLFGYHIVQVGCVGGEDLLGASRISHRVVLDIGPVRDHPSLPLCLAAALPIQAQSVDVVVLPHVLEFESDPHVVLRETERVLIGEGHVVVLGINPWSLWGVWRVALAWRGSAPWIAKFLGIERVKDWLHVLGFDIIETRNFFFRPPIAWPWLQQKLRFVEGLGQFLWPFFGGAYIVVGRKRVVTVTPVARRLRRRNRVAINGVVGQPTCGVSHE